MTMAVTPTRMEPSPGRGVSTRTTKLEASSIDDASELPTPTGVSSSSSPNLVEEDLYAIPPELKPTYRPLDWLSHALLYGVTGNIALVWDASNKSRKILNAFAILFQKGPIIGLTEIMLACQRASWNTTWQWMRWLLGFLLRCTVLTTFTTMILQDLFLRPSRISAQNLKEYYTLPSTLSKFEHVSVMQGQNASTTIGLHWLEYHNKDVQPATTTTSQKRILYCNHGFGASSLSWLPSLKRMTQKFKCQVGLAHDALGFGFSEPPTESDDDDHLHWYSAAASARLATSLLQRYSLGQNDSLTLLGHSMGSLTTLRLALALPKEMEKRIILVAPALGLRQPPSSSTKTTRTKWGAPLRLARSWLLERPFQYVLRRAVGYPGFWRKGLSSAWGDAARLKDTDVLRFQWPSIHKGWEAGLTRFARAQTRSFPDDDLGIMPDEELLIRVLALPNTTVEVILGGKDRVVSPDRVRRFLEPFPRVPIQKLPDLGHDPFEEDVDAFLNVVK